MGLSKTAKKCDECNLKDVCNSMRNVEHNAMYVGEENTSITLNSGDSGKFQVLLEDFKKQIEEEIFNGLGVGAEYLNTRR